jgi:hypothetical protein
MAKNQPGAEFCWRCLDRLAGGSARMGGSSFGSGPAARPGGQQDGGASRRPFEGFANPSLTTGSPATSGASHGPSAGWHKPVALVVGVLVLLGAIGYVVIKNRAPNLVMPASVIGLRRVQGAEASALESQISHIGAASGVVAKAALYGYGTAPSLLVLAYAQKSSRPPETDFRTFAAGFAAGLASTGQTVTIKLETMTSTTRDGVSYVCASVSGVWRNLCMWNDGASIGFVVLRRVSVDRLDLTAVIRNDVRGG